MPAVMQVNLMGVKLVLHLSQVTSTWFLCKVWTCILITNRVPESRPEQVLWLFWVSRKHCRRKYLSIIQFSREEGGWFFFLWPASCLGEQTMILSACQLFHNPWAKLVPTSDINHWSTECITAFLISPCKPPAPLPLPSTPPTPLNPPWVGRLWVSLFQSLWWWWRGLTQDWTSLPT